MISILKHLAYSTAMSKRKSGCVTFKLIEFVQKKLVKNKTIEQIAEALEEDVSTISEIVEKL